MGAASASAFSGAGLACRRGERPVFAGLDFRARPGGALVLRGPNGAGKSSLLRLLAGLVAPVAGELRWGEAPALEDREAHAARLHFLGHQDGIKPVLTAREHLRFWTELRGLRAEAAALDAALDQMALLPLARTPGRMLSAGQKRRLALARLAAAPAPLWLLDEPSTGLDEAALAAFESMLAAHRARGGIVILATHAPVALPGAALLDMAEFARRARAA